MKIWLNVRQIFLISLLAVTFSLSGYSVFGQTMRNPVLEFCTGVW